MRKKRMIKRIERANAKFANVIDELRTANRKLDADFGLMLSWFNAGILYERRRQRNLKRRQTRKAKRGI